jgi:hypothetical protein
VRERERERERDLAETKSERENDPTAGEKATSMDTQMCVEKNHDNFE